MTSISVQAAGSKCENLFQQKQAILDLSSNPTEEQIYLQIGALVEVYLKFKAKIFLMKINLNKVFRILI
ncbi:MAG: hypothetical protein WA160_14055 [Pseudobdellovibrio sp.]